MPSFAEAGFVWLERPFRDAIAVHASPSGEASLRTRVTCATGLALLPVHWEIARQPDFAEVERYGLLLAQAHALYEIGIPLVGLESRRRYWARLWAGGHWSHAVMLPEGRRWEQDARRAAGRSRGSA